MNEEFKLHSNWKALATVHIPYKVFVSGSSDSSNSVETSIPPKNKNLLNSFIGDEIQKFYEEEIILKTINDNEKQCNSTNINNIKYDKNKCENRLISSSFNDCVNKKMKYIPFDKNKFFRAAIQNDVKLLQKFNLSEININCCDEFGWTALMMAACEGSLDTFTYLLKHNSNLNICDKKGNNAYSLAKMNRHNKILKIITNELENLKKNKKSPPLRETLKLKTDDLDNKEFYCKECKTKFTQTNRKNHETSTVHQFNIKRENNNEKLKFSFISSNNRGLKLMLKQGWDKQSGLGPSKTGNLYPVKTVIRKGRTGLGIEQYNKPKVTHFKPNDLSAIKYKPNEFEQKTRKELRKQQKYEKHREKYLRDELS